MTKVVCDLYLDGLSPQAAIRKLTDIIGRAKLNDKRFLVIEQYRENYGHPFQEGDLQYRVILREEANG